MRCPKCGYISFDHLESCKKCNKNISEASGDLDGTVFAVASPTFLNFEPEETHGQMQEAEETFTDEERLDDVEETMDHSYATDDGDEIVMNFDVEEELDNFGTERTDDKSTFHLDDIEEISLEDEITLDFDAEEETQKAEEDMDGGLQLDFGDIDISDLAPPEEKNDELAPETLTLEEDVHREAVLAGGPTTASAPVAPGSGLEDLQIEDLDLDTPAPLVAGSKAGDKLMPSVKTGTALDDFEIDLGELTSGVK